MKLWIPFKLRQGPLGTSRLVSGKSSLLSSCKGEQRFALQALQGNQASSCIGVCVCVGGGNLVVYFEVQREDWVSLKLRWGPQGTFPVAYGKSGLLSSCGGHIEITLQSLLGNRESSRTEVEHLVVLSRCNRHLDVLMEFKQGSQALSHLELHFSLEV